MKICSCTGHRPQKFPFEYGGNGTKYITYLQTLEANTELAVREYGITNFISGMALGVDLDFAEIVLKLRNDYPITLECAIPCPDQTLKWNSADKLRYHGILKRADEINLISERYTPECMLKRNRYMIDKSDLVIAVFNGTETGGTQYTIRYAQTKRVPILTINLNKI